MAKTDWKLTESVLPEDMNEIGEEINDLKSNKVDKSPGKDLSTNDYTTEEKTKLENIEDSANNYEHPANHPASIITETVNKRFVSDTEKETWNSKETTTGAQEKANNAETNVKEWANEFGLGSPKAITDFNVLENGFYYADAGATNAPNITGEFVVFVSTKDGNNGSQVATERLSDGSSKVFVRSVRTNVYGDWQELISKEEAEQKIKVISDELVSHQAEDATLTKKGHVQLSNATDNESESLAATPKAVKKAMDRADSAFTSASNGKTLISNAITGIDDSVVIPSDPSFANLVSAINSVSTGVKTASGSVTVNSPYLLKVTGLGFEPSLVYIYGNGFSIGSSTSGRGWGLFSKYDHIPYSNNLYTIVGAYGGMTSGGVSGGSNIHVKNTELAKLFTDEGFEIDISGPLRQNTVIKWIAYE